MAQRRFALSSVSLGRRDSVKSLSNSSLRISLSAFLAVTSLPMRLVAFRNRSLTAGPLMSLRCLREVAVPFAFAFASQLPSRLTERLSGTDD